MCVTEAEYTAITGDAPPEDLAACLTLAQNMLDARTLCFYAGRDAATLPGLIQRSLKHYCAYQAQAISLAGGVAGVMEPPLAGATLGKYSFTAGVGAKAFSPAAAALLPLLVSYAKCE